MHNIETAASGSFIADARLRQGIGLCGLVLFGVLSTVFMFLQPASAAGPTGVPEVAADSADISSPQSTFASLLRLTGVLHELVRDDGITGENQQRVKNIHQQMRKLFDLREVPPKYRQHMASETAVYLREALARFHVPPTEDMPDEEQMVAWIKQGKAAQYRLPGTPVVIKRVNEGVYEGRYQFSPATVADAKSWFYTVNTYPYHEGQGYIAGLYDAYFMTPGPLIPLELIRTLPHWMESRYLGQTVWQWLLLIAVIPVMVGLIYLWFVLVTRLAGVRRRLQRSLVMLLWPIGVIYITLAARSFLQSQVMLSGEVLQNVLFIAKLIILAAVVSLVMRSGSLLTEIILRVWNLDTRKIEQQLVRLGIRMLTILVAVVIVIEGMQQIGFSLATLVAGAGVTGLAIALAAQDTLKNVFGGLLLAMDRPFEAGQRVQIKGYDGFIQEVGLRSTKVRTLQGHQIIIPNDEAARVEVENIGRRPYIRRELNVTITYDTAPEKIARAVQILEEILAVPERSSDGAPTHSGGETGAPHPNEAVNQPEFPPRVYFNDLNADSLNLLVVYWFHPPDVWASLEFAHRVNIQIMERFNAEGIEFAFPSQTLYLAGDNKRPISLGEQLPVQSTAVGPEIAKASATTGAAKSRRADSMATSRDASIEQELLDGEDEGEGEGDADDAGVSSS